MSEIEAKRLYEDRILYDKMAELAWKGSTRTEEEEKKYRELEYKYYVENDDIRIFWKTYWKKTYENQQ